MRKMENIEEGEKMRSREGERHRASEERGNNN